MSRDEWVMASLVVAFAALVTVHVTLVVGLAARGPRWGVWRALAALVVLPLAPYWGARAGMGVRSALWLLCACWYGVSRGLAGR